jgi:hypothetical protein
MLEVHVECAVRKIISPQHKKSVQAGVRRKKECNPSGGQALYVIRLISGCGQTPAAEGFDLVALHFPHINQSSCVRMLTNFDSTSLPVWTMVEAKVHSAYVEIWNRNTAWRGVSVAIGVLNRFWNRQV